MADNIAVTQGSGTTLASDDISSVQYPRIKISWGVNGAAVDASATDPFPTVQTGALPAGTNNIGDVDILSIAAGNNNIGDVDVASIAAGTNVIGYVGLEPRTSGGLSMATAILGASTNATVVKASAGQVFSIQAFNNSATIAYLKLYNKASTPDENDTPVKVLAIPGSTDAAGFILDQPQGLAFATGIAYRVVTGIANNSTAATSASTGTINVDYK